MLFKVKDLVVKQHPTNTHARTHTRTHARTRTHTRTHARTHTNTHTHTHTHTHVGSPSKETLLGYLEEV